MSPKNRIKSIKINATYILESIPIIYLYLHQHRVWLKFQQSDFGLFGPQDAARCVFSIHAPHPNGHHFWPTNWQSQHVLETEKWMTNCMKLILLLWQNHELLFSVAFWMGVLLELSLTSKLALFLISSSTILLRPSIMYWKNCQTVSLASMQNSHCFCRTCLLMHSSAAMCSPDDPQCSVCLFGPISVCHHLQPFDHLKINGKQWMNHWRYVATFGLTRPLASGVITRMQNKHISANWIQELKWFRNHTLAHFEIYHGFCAFLLHFVYVRTLGLTFILNETQSVTLSYQIW